ncbi:MAG TPA: FapA family protein [Bacillota bacterium]|nr:FapA family protein [Bacillota bacterium]
MSDKTTSKNFYRKEVKIVPTDPLISNPSKPADKSAQIPEDIVLQTGTNSQATNPGDQKADDPEADEKNDELTGLKNDQSQAISAQITEEISANTEESSTGTTPANKKSSEISEVDQKIFRLIGLKSIDEIINKMKSAPTFVNGSCRVIISADFMEAYLLIEPPKNSVSWPTLEEALITIKGEGLSEFDQQAVEDAVERRLVTQVLIAKGTPPIHGLNSDFHILYELIDLHKLYIEGLVEDQYHRVDYHKVKTVNSVEKGDFVAEKIPATPGANGMDIRGQVIPAVPGQDQEIKLGKNVIWDDTGLKVYATSPGKPILINQRLNVLPVHEVKGNVNFLTGNIDFAGNLVVRGDVENGFNVKADGDIIIMGHVDGADITAGGKLSIKGKVFGMDRSKIECNGDFYAKEIERANLNCRGTVSIKEAIMHCQVIAENKVMVEGGKGWIVGGTIQAGESVEASIIGSRLGTITEIEVSPSYRHFAEDPTGQPGADIVPEIKSSSESSRPSRTAAGSEDQTKVEYTTRGRIKYKDRLYPGVRIKISPFCFLIQDELRSGILYCTNDGDLRLIPS